MELAFAGSTRMNLTNYLDYIVVESFPESEVFLTDAKYIPLLPSWKDQVENRSSNLIFLRRFNISAPGTCFLAYYSDEPAAPTELMSMITKIDEDDAKIICIWVNSIVHLVQVMYERIETEGAYMELPEWAMKDLFVIDPRELTQKERDSLLEVFDQVSNVEFPSIMDQVSRPNNAKMMVDEAVLSVLGYSKNEVRELLARLNAAMKEEIASLKNMMGGGIN